MKPYKEAELKRKYWKDLWEIFWETYHKTKFHKREALLRYFQKTYMQDTFTNNKSQAIYINFPIARP